MLHASESTFICNKKGSLFQLKLSGTMHVWISFEQQEGCVL
jgi:hypothetical protein